jgi:hypothetical protein
VCSLFGGGGGGGDERTGEGHTMDVSAGSTRTTGDDLDKKETTPGERMSSCRHGMGLFGTLSSWQKSPRSTQARVE